MERRKLKMLSAVFFREMALIQKVVLELDKEGFVQVLKNRSSEAMAKVGEIHKRLRQNDPLAKKEPARPEFLTNTAHEPRPPHRRQQRWADGNSVCKPGKPCVRPVQDHGYGTRSTPAHFRPPCSLDRLGDELNSGRGLGVSIARQVIHQHTRTLVLESQPGKGSVFTLCLPMRVKTADAGPV